MIFSQQRQANQENLVCLGSQSVYQPKALIKSEKQNSLEEKSKAQLLKDNNSTKITQLAVKYKQCVQYGPALGIYVLPQLDDFFNWEFYLFIREGYYKDAKLKGQIHFNPDKSNSIHFIQFYTPVFHPFVNFLTGSLDLQQFTPKNSQPPQELFKFLTSFKNIFTDKQHLIVQNSFNPEAAKLFKKNQNLFIEKVFETTVLPSQEQLFDEPQQTLDSCFEKNQIFTESLKIRQGIKQKLRQICSNSFKSPELNFQKQEQENQQSPEQKAQKLMAIIMGPDFHFEL